MINRKNTKELKNYLGMFRNVYLYGAGREAERVLKFLEKTGIEVAAVVVTDKAVNPETVMGISVLQITDIPVQKQNAFILGVSEVYSQEIEATLRSLEQTNIIKLFSKTEVWKLNRPLPKLEITARIGCRIQCRYCPQKTLYEAYFRENAHRCSEMSMETFRKCISHMPGNTVITFAGFVEPFLHPHGVEMILYAHEKGHPVELYTTFAGLTREQFDSIKDIPFREVVLHTPDAKHYAEIPVTEEYLRILDEALDRKKANGEPFIDSANCQSEPSEEFLEIARGRIQVTSVLNDRAGVMCDDSLKHSIYKCGTLVCNRSNQQNHWVLLPDGTVVLCCMDFGLRHSLGNLLESDYEGIINGEAYRTLRGQMCSQYQEKEILCRRCTSSSVIKDR